VWLENPNGLVELVQPTPYGEWKIHWHGDKTIMEGLIYAV
jgi:chromatin segregation and condensation protein Rec8/ScpA/Scc1 (kleisin family)